MWNWNNILINQSYLRDKFTDDVIFRLTTRVRCFYTRVIHLSFPSDFKDKFSFYSWINKICFTWQNHGDRRSFLENVLVHIMKVNGV